MNDTYVEVMVKKKDSPFLGVGKILLWGIAIACLVVGAIGWVVMFVPAVIFGCIAYFVIPMLDLEYEYLYLDKEISIDKVMAKEKRKHCMTLDLNKMEVMAPENSHELDSYKARNLKVSDFSSQLPDTKPYMIAINGNDGMSLVKIEPSAEMLKAIKQVFPRKVVEY